MRIVPFCLFGSLPCLAIQCFQPTFVDYQAAYDSQRLLKFTLYAGF